MFDTFTSLHSKIQALCGDIEIAELSPDFAIIPERPRDPMKETIITNSDCRMLIKAALLWQKLIIKARGECDIQKAEALGLELNVIKSTVRLSFGKLYPHLVSEWCLGFTLEWRVICTGEFPKGSTQTDVLFYVI